MYSPSACNCKMGMVFWTAPRWHWAHRAHLQLVHLPCLVHHLPRPSPLHPCTIQEHPHSLPWNSINLCPISPTLLVAGRGRQRRIVWVRHFAADGWVKETAASSKSLLRRHGNMDDVYSSWSISSVCKGHDYVFHRNIDQYHVSAQSTQVRQSPLSHAKIECCAMNTFVLMLDKHAL